MISVLAKLKEWRSGGKVEEMRNSDIQIRSVADNKVWFHVVLRHDMQGNKFKVDHEVIIGPEQDDQSVLIALVDLCLAEYTDSLSRQESGGGVAQIVSNGNGTNGVHQS